MADDNTCRCGADRPSKGSQRLDEIFTALSATRRRYILHYLQEEERASLTDVAEQITTWEEECPTDELPEESIEELETVLYHNHLPKLRDAAIIEYDERSGMLVFRDPPEVVEICLEQCVPRDLPD